MSGNRIVRLFMSCHVFMLPASHLVSLHYKEVMHAVPIVGFATWGSRGGWWLLMKGYNARHLISNHSLFKM